jgi:hypothetical protein
MVARLRMTKDAILGRRKGPPVLRGLRRSLVTQGEGEGDLLLRAPHQP